MTWTVEDREKAIKPCDFDKQGNDNQCQNCKHSKPTEDNIYMGRDCSMWCVVVMYDEVCGKHRPIKQK